MPFYFEPYSESSYPLVKNSETLEKCDIKNYYYLDLLICNICQRLKKTFSMQKIHFPF